MTAPVIDLADRRDSADRVAEHRAAIWAASTLAAIDEVRVRVNADRAAERLSWSQHRDLIAEVVLRRESLLTSGFVDEFAGDPCPRCEHPMVREVNGEFDEQDRGKKVLREEDRCPSCGFVQPLLWADEWDLDELKRRVGVVVGHRRAVAVHDRCAPWEPCQARRPGEWTKPLQVVAHA